MTRTIIYQTDKFTIISYGNGLSYTMWNKPAGRELLVQGDDASKFRDDLEAIEARNPD